MVEIKRQELVAVAGGFVFLLSDSISPDCVKKKADLKRVVGKLQGLNSSFYDAVFGSNGQKQYRLSKKLYEEEIQARQADYDNKCRGRGTADPVVDPQKVSASGTDQERVVVPQSNPSYAVSAEAMAAKRPSAFGLFARDAANSVEQFSDTMVATAAHDAKVVGQFAKDVIAPVAIGAALVYGLAKMVETGDTSTIQRAWAMVR